MTDVYVAGVGQTVVGEHWDTSLRDLALEAIREATLDAGDLRPQALYVGNMLAPNLSNQAHLGALLADNAFLPGVEAVTVEAAGASGGSALRQGYLAIASGMIDAALVVGVEKLTDRVGPGVEAAIASTQDSDFESLQGLTPAAQAALLMRRYMQQNAVPSDGLSGFAVTAHENASGNQYAMFRKSITRETYLRSSFVNEPLRQFDAAPNADGAAAIMLVSSKMLPSPVRNYRVRIAGSASAVDTLSLHDRHDVLQFAACRHSVETALQSADVALAAVDFFEYHDAYSVYAALALEEAGFAERGNGWKLAADGSISLGGRIPAATMGGLKARGYPGGATGVYQAVEAVLQLQDRAGKNQIRRASCGLIQSVGGPGATAVSHVFVRET